MAVLLLPAHARLAIQTRLLLLLLVLLVLLLLCKLSHDLLGQLLASICVPHA
jgi:hypothetical protein